MAKHPTAHPVSGEIKAGSSHSATGRSGPLPFDVVEAEFEVLAPGDAWRLPRQGGPRQGAGHASDEPVMTGLGILSQAGYQRSRLFAVSGGVAFWSGGAALVAAAFWISGGHAMLTAQDGPGSTAAASAMTLDDVVSRVDFSGAKPVIFVDGHVSNDGARSARLSALEIRVADLHGLITTYKLGTSAGSLNAGEQYIFSSRLDVPKNGVKTVAVTFAE